MALFCPLQGVIDIISKKWSLLVINEVGNHKSIRFNELKRELRGITAKSLTNTLNEVQSNGLISRKDFVYRLYNFQIFISVMTFIPIHNEIFIDRTSIVLCNAKLYIHSI
jgi:DNA-binding HxlR family transcriptional regulator